MAFFKIIASTLGADTGPFVIKSNTGAILATGVTRTQLLDGFTVNVPAGVTSVTIENAPSNTTCTTTQTLPIPNEGRWEMEKSNVETISDHYGVILNPFATPVETFVADDIVGIYAGVVSGTTGTWLIKAGPEDIVGTTYNGGGKLIVVGLNTNTQTTVESGAHLQIGYDTDSLAGQVGTNLTINAGGIVNAVGAYEMPGGRPIGNLVNNGTLTFEGPDRCGEGVFRLFGTVVNSGVVTIKDNAKLQFGIATAFNATPGIFRVENGATLDQNTANLPASQTLQLNGCGKCNDVGSYEGALLYGGSGAIIASPIVLQSDVCMDHTGTGQVTFTGALSGNFKISLNNQADSTTRAGSTTFANSTGGTFDNTIEVKNTTLYNTGANALSKADIVLVENGGFQQDGGVVNLGSFASASSTAYTMLNSSASIVLKENGSTTYAGNLYNSTPGTPWNFTIDGPSTNVIKLSNPATDNVMNLRSTNGGRIIFEGTRVTSYAATGGGTISAGTKIEARIDSLTLTANDALDVYASGTTTGRVWPANALSVTAGWKVNLMESLPAGTHQILRGSPTVLPTLGTNLSGRTVTGFANIGGFLTVTLA
jgi:hypothetical protein